MATLEESRPETAAESTSDFSYSEKDLLGEVSQKLNEKLRDFRLVESSREQVKVNFVRAYGEAFRSTRKTPKYNGAKHSSLIFSLRLELQWYGRSVLGDTTLGSATGKIKVGEIDVTNAEDPAKWDFEVKLDIECPVGMPQQEAEKNNALIEPSQVEASLKDAVTRTGLDKVRPALKEAIRTTLLETDGLDTSLAEEKSDATVQENDRDPFDDPQLANLRRQMLGRNYLRVVDGEAEGEVEWNLRLCTIHDRDMEDLCGQLKKNTQLKKLDFYFNSIGDEGMCKLVEAIKGLPELESLDMRNNKIGDTGVQSLMMMLALGGAPNLKRINLQENQEISTVGRTIITGMQAVRKNVVVEL